MSARSDLDAHLRATLGTEYQVIEATNAPTVSKRTVMTWVEDVARGASQGLRLYHVTVLVLVPGQTGESTEAALEDALDEVLWAIDSLDTAAWTDAKRATYADYPAYQVTVNVTTRTS